MSTETPGAATQEQKTPQLQIRAQLTRKLTFNNPGALKRFESNPQVTVNINVDAGKGEDDHYLVGLRIDATAKSGDDGVYDISVDYAGLFHVTNVEPRSIEPLLLIECPRILFPFARRIVADATRDGGYAPLMLDPVDFVALYRRELERRGAAQNATNQNGTVS